MSLRAPQGIAHTLPVLSQCVLLTEQRNPDRPWETHPGVYFSLTPTEGQSRPAWNWGNESDCLSGSLLPHHIFSLLPHCSSPSLSLSDLLRRDGSVRPSFCERAADSSPAPSSSLKAQLLPGRRGGSHDESSRTRAPVRSPKPAFLRLLQDLFFSRCRCSEYHMSPNRPKIIIIVRYNQQLCKIRG